MAIRCSALWDYFTDLGDFYASCNVCNTKLSYRTATSNLNKHFQRKHGALEHATLKSKLKILTKQVDEPEDDKGEIQKMIINQKVVRYEPTLVEKDSNEGKNQDSFPTISINGKRTIRDSWDGNNFAGSNNTADCTSSQNFYSSVGNRSSSPSVLSEDEFDIAGKKLSVDLRSLNFKQRVIAEKLIGDAIFYGKLGKLNENCQIQFPY